MEMEMERNKEEIITMKRPRINLRLHMNEL